MSDKEEFIRISLLAMSCSSTSEKTVETEIAETGSAQNSTPIANNQKIKT
jgi:hypothetical protein